MTPRGDPAQTPPDATVPGATPSEAFANDATLQPPARQAARPESPSESSPPGTPASPFANDATLPPPPRTVGGNAPQFTLPFATAAPQDATLDPNDPQAQAYQQAVTRSSPIGQTASFGDYQIIDTIAKGGMGIVYKARQRKLNRVVAIKMILAGQFADDTDVDRFYAEAAAAGALQHPNIVGIHEVGEVNGQHFFSMDYVDGDSLSALVREHPLLPPEAAQYVKTIAETMQFAHEQGIVHRDLKPSNVLVDKQSRPLITDFGLAKSVSAQSQLTMSGAIVGTPSYMPPEQAKGESERVGPRSDIYSTGAILYELVTGHPPFRAATPFETIRQVIDTDPISPRMVNPSVPKDLETICLKCLQKEPANRYQTSQELADELGRFLRGEPIIARPIGRIARIWRWCQRNPVPATAIAASVLFLMIAVISSTVGLVQTRRALAVSEASFRAQMSAVNDLMTRVSENTLLNQPGLQPLRKDLLERALAYYERFAQERANDPAVQDELAAAYFRIGAITEAIESADKALTHYQTAKTMQEKLLQQRPKDPARLDALGTTLNALGTLKVRQQQYDSAQQEFTAALATREQLVTAEPDNVEYQRLLGNTHMNIGLAYYNAGKSARARKELLEAQRIHLQALRREPRNLKLRRDVGKGYYNLGNVNWFDQQTAQAEKDFQSAVQTFDSLIKDQPNDLENNNLHAICLRFLGDIHADDAPDIARQRYGEAIERLDRLVSKNPDVLEYQLALAGVWMNVGILESSHGKSATVEYQQARRILVTLSEKYPTEQRFRRDLAKTLHALGYEQQLSRDFTDARQQFSDACDIFQGLIKQHGHDADFLAQYAGASLDLGQLEMDQSNFAAAVEAFRTACELRESLTKIAPREPYHRLDLAVALRQLGTAQQKAGVREAGSASLQRARALLLALKSQLPKEVEVEEELKLLSAALAADGAAD